LPEEKWHSDTSCIWAAAGRFYPAVIIGFFSRRFVGWVLDRRLTTALVGDAFRMAWRQTRPGRGLP
jgi:putative transposase